MSDTKSIITSCEYTDLRTEKCWIFVETHHIGPVQYDETAVLQDWDEVCNYIKPRNFTREAGDSFKQHCNEYAQDLQQKEPA